MTRRKHGTVTLLVSPVPNTGVASNANGADEACPDDSDSAIATYLTDEQMRKMVDNGIPLCEFDEILWLDGSWCQYDESHLFLNVREDTLYKRLMPPTPARKEKSVVGEVGSRVLFAFGFLLTMMIAIILDCVLFSVLPTYQHCFHENESVPR